ncbi:hypothetical protein LTR86_007445 [Recurvomyces mirabilis]|nr:hypothetical protein LTR86_007445 [Recurvomyces mirabilis]
MEIHSPTPSVSTQRSSLHHSSLDLQESTPGTSPASQGTDATWSRSRGNTHLSADTVAFVGDLRNYLALGCIVVYASGSRDRGDATEEWQELDDLSFPDFGAFLAPEYVRLIEARWLRVQLRCSDDDVDVLILRLNVLPYDAGHRFVDRRDSKLWAALQSILPEVDVSPETWRGQGGRSGQHKFDPWATRDEGSLFYMFNKLASPDPSINAVGEHYAKEALEDLLDPASVLPGLKTVLYPYQRRSAGLMLQREAAPRLDLDPRLEQRIAPDGSTYYYGAKEPLFLRQPRYFETCKGGILAETMGLGKTVILLALILATKDHLPRIPPAYANTPVRRKVGSLSDIAVSNINRKSIPWKVEFARIKHVDGNEMSSCIAKLERSPPMYEIPQEPQRWNRNTILPPPKKITLAATTLIVVPRNLCKQWQSELQKHVEDTALKVLVMEDLKRALPLPEELRTYDVVLFSRNRFELEIKDGSDEQGRRILATQLVCRCPYIGATRTRDCHCIRNDDLYDSPLKHLHFKRLVIDEGHFFSNNNNSAVTVANKLVTADHRWVISGTPAKDLLGVEVDISSTEVWSGDKDFRAALLEQRSTFNHKEDTAGAIKSLGALASSFLKIRPWYALSVGERKEAEWDDYIYRHEDARRRTYSGFSTCLKRTLEAMVVKTQPEDVERDIELPPLRHEIIRLEPSFYDKLTANLFTLVLTANAITSERTDEDYLFHKKSAKPRYQLISNLRQSAFFWSGFSEADIRASLENSERYLAKEGTNCRDADRQLLTTMLESARLVLSSKGWKSMSRSHELGLFVNGWPVNSADHWKFDKPISPLLTGISQLLGAQKHVNERAGLQDPGEGLNGVGIRACAPAKHGSIKMEDETQSKAIKPLLTKAGIPTSSLDGEPVLKRRMSGSKISPKKSQRAFKVTKPQYGKKSKRKMSLPANFDVATIDDSLAGASSSSKAEAPKRKRRRSELEEIQFASDSPYLQSSIVGTTSAKLSYLISQISKYHENEKILVFYEGDNIAYYIAQALELLHIKHEIYAKSLAASLKSEYVVRFDQEQQDRVLLMDVKQAAFGLNLSSASRIYFVNPVCRPGIEAQAIKRAHRIGQTRKVVVETLVLKGTIEEKMLERSRRMTRSEHLDAKVLEDDGGMRAIIQSAEMLDIEQHEKEGYGQMASLEVPQQLWGREGWKETVANTFVSVRADVKQSDLQQVEKNVVEREKKKQRVIQDYTKLKKVWKETKKEKRPRRITFQDITQADEEARLVDDDADDAGPSSAKKRRTLAFVDCTGQEPEGRYVGSSDEEPLADLQNQKMSFVMATNGDGQGLRLDTKFCTLNASFAATAPDFSPLISPTVAPVALSTTCDLGRQRMSIETLLNDGDAGPSSSKVTTEERRRSILLQDILHCL